MSPFAGKWREKTGRLSGKDQRIMKRRDFKMRHLLLAHPNPNEQSHSLLQCDGKLLTCWSVLWQEAQILFISKRTEWKSWPDSVSWLIQLPVGGLVYLLMEKLSYLSPLSFFIAKLTISPVNTSSSLIDQKNLNTKTCSKACSVLVSFYVFWISKSRKTKTSCLVTFWMVPLKPSLSAAALASRLKSGAPPTYRDSFRLRAVCWFWWDRTGHRTGFNT